MDDYPRPRNRLQTSPWCHFCLGAHLARMEARVAPRRCCVGSTAVDDDNVVRVHSSNVRPDFAHLPICIARPSIATPKTSPPPGGPTVVTGASSGIGGRRNQAFTGRGFPVPAWTSWSTKSDGGEDSLDVTDPEESVKSFVAQTIRGTRRDRTAGGSAGDMLQLHEVLSRRPLRQVQIHLVDCRRLATVVLPAMVVTLRRIRYWACQRPHMGALRRRQGQSYGADGYCSRTIVHRDPLDRYGLAVGRAPESAQCWRTGQVG